MISKILVPVDGSDNSLRALDHAIFIAKSTGAGLTAMNVVERPPTVYVESQKILDDLLARYRAEAEKILDRCKQLAEKSGVTIETVLAEGDAASSIVGYAHNEGFNMVAIGSRG